MKHSRGTIIRLLIDAIQSLENVLIVTSNLVVADFEAN
jgi:hypothetical protein